jgi:hypothetical protein
LALRFFSPKNRDALGSQVVHARSLNVSPARRRLDAIALCSSTYGELTTSKKICVYKASLKREFANALAGEKFVNSHFACFYTLTCLQFCLFPEEFALQLKYHSFPLNASLLVPSWSRDPCTGVR